MPTARTTRHYTATTLAIAAAIVLAGCDGSTQAVRPDPTTPGVTGGPTSGTPSGSPTAPADQRAAVEAAYREFWRVGQSFDRDYPQPQWRGVLSRVAADPVLSRALSGARLQRQNGTVLYGQVVLRPRVVSVGPQGRARVSDCQDTSRTGQADAKSGKHRTVGVPRSPVNATLVRGVDGHWRVSDVEYTGGWC